VYELGYHIGGAMFRDIALVVAIISGGLLRSFQRAGSGGHVDDVKWVRACLCSTIRPHTATGENENDK
jgi:hypothetical protein